MSAYQPDGYSILDRPGDPEAVRGRLASVRSDDQWRPGDHGRSSWSETERRWVTYQADPDTGDYLTDASGHRVPVPYLSPSSEPRGTFTARHGIYRTEWPAQGVVIDLDLIRSERGGDLTAEARVEVWGRHVHTARVTLTGTRSRLEFAKHVRSRADGAADFDWDGAIEAASVRTIEAHRAGAPAIRIRDAVQPLEDGDLVAPLAKARLPVILFGDGGSAKSYLALALAASIQTGHAYLGLPVSGKRTVGYLDWELSDWDHRQRLQLLAGSLAEAVGDIVYVPCSAPLTESVDRLRRIAAEHGIGYWIVDSITFACDGPPEASDVAGRYFNALRELGGGSLSIAHVTKGGEGADLKPFGSAHWHNGARATWFAKGSEDGDTLTVALYPRKNNVGRKGDPIAFRFTFAEDATLVERTDVSGVPELARKLPIADRIAPLVRAGALTIHELADELDESVEAVRIACKRAAKRQFLQPVTGPDGVERWGLAALRTAA